MPHPAVTDQERKGETYWAWMEDGGDAGIGIISVIMPRLGTSALITRSRAVSDVMRDLALAHGRASGHRVWRRQLVMQADEPPITERA